ncbi:MAG: VanW family protein [Candidatus Roizmanbacteria bacterium]|nr:VanW family protein [Candidatus Roizmanbacteria bacterium]
MIPKKTRRLLIQLSIGLVIVFTLSIGLFYFSQITKKELANRLFPNVTINGQNVGKMNKTEVYLVFSDLESKIQKSMVNVVYENTPIATFSATTLGAKLNIDDAFDKAYIVGRSSHVPSQLFQTVVSVFGLKHFEFPLKMTYDKQPVQEALGHLSDLYEKDPVNAKFQFESGKVVVFEKEDNGLHVEITKALSDIDALMQKRIIDQSPATIIVKKTVLKPKITLAQTNTFGVEELIGEGVSDYTHSIPQRIHNLLLGTSKFNGVLIPKGATFSFNETVGDISSTTGYQPAYLIKEGKTVLGDGGGICQVSTTLFRAVLNTGLPISEYHSHAYRVGYYENDAKPGLDATVYGPTVDFKFVNDTSASILIQTSADEENHKLFFKFYGKKDNRSVQLSTPILTDYAPAPEAQYQDDPTLKKGVTKQIDFAASGGRARFSYKVTKGNEVTFQKDFQNWYQPWRAVFLVGTAD